MKDVKKFEYPSKVTTTQTLVGLWQTSKLSTLFHLLMAVLLISGLVIDLLGFVLGGSLLAVRSIVHGYLGAVFTVVYPIYLIQIIVTKKIRMLMTAENWINFVLYAVLIVTGVSIASTNQIWMDLMPWLASALSGVRQLSPVIHTVTTYAWLLFSIIFPGGFLHGIATVYLATIKKRGEK